MPKCGIKCKNAKGKKIGAKNSIEMQKLLMKGKKISTKNSSEKYISMKAKKFLNRKNSIEIQKR